MMDGWGWGPPDSFPALTSRLSACMLSIWQRRPKQHTEWTRMWIQILKLIGLILISLFFLMLGIDLLVAAYRLNNPFNFVMTFFASNLMILISAVLALGFILRLRRRIKNDPEPEQGIGPDPEA